MNEERGEEEKEKSVIHKLSGPPSWKCEESDVLSPATTNIITQNEAMQNFIGKIRGKDNVRNDTIFSHCITERYCVSHNLSLSLFSLLPSSLALPLSLLSSPLIIVIIYSYQTEIKDRESDRLRSRAGVCESDLNPFRWI